MADRAAQKVLDAGVTIVAAAGNQNEDSCGRSPARVPGVIAVGNMGEGDVRSETSNVGACISLWAPGRNILAAGHTADNATAIKTGTSMAAPVSSFLHLRAVNHCRHLANTVLKTFIFQRPSLGLWHCICRPDGHLKTYWLMPNGSMRLQM